MDQLKTVLAPLKQFEEQKQKTDADKARQKQLDEEARQVYIAVKAAMNNNKCAIKRSSMSVEVQKILRANGFKVEQSTTGQSKGAAPGWAASWAPAAKPNLKPRHLI